MKKAVYLGTFDPVTNGHLDIIRRGARLAQELVVGVGINIEKQPLFSIDERISTLKELVAPLGNVVVAAFSGMAVDFVKSQGSTVILRGVRTPSDFEGEMAMAMTNRVFDADIETLFLMTIPEYQFISSRFIKETAKLGGDVSKLVPPLVAAKLAEKFKS